MGPMRPPETRCAACDHERKWHDESYTGMTDGECLACREASFERDPRWETRCEAYTEGA
jgi:hypothetical protein